MAHPEDVLSEEAYKNYRNVRAVALLFIVLGTIFVFGAIPLLADPDKYPKVSPVLKHPAVATGLAVAGLAGLIGGIAVRRGNREWAPLVKGIAWVYVFAFPVGTVLSLTLLNGFPKYLRSVDRLRRAQEEEEDEEDDEEDDEDT